MRNRFVRLLAVSLLSIPLALSGCTRAGTMQGSSDSITIAQIQEPRSLNPLFLDGYNSNEIGYLLFSYLTTYDLSGHVIPQAVTQVPTQRNGGISKDGMTYVFHLRHGIRWQDGAPLTSRDVAFSFDAIMNPGNNTLSRYGYDAVAWVRTPSDSTVIVRLKYPLSPFVTYFFGGNSNYPILPSHVLAKYASLNEVPFNANPIGSGPYRLTGWSRGDHMTFVANNSYYLGTPSIKRIVIRYIPNTQTIINQLRTRETDAFFFGDVSHITDLKSIPGHRIQTAQTTWFETLLFNTTDRFFRDPLMRRAFAMAIDRHALTEKITHGVYDPDSGMRGLFTWAYDPTVGNIPYDPAAASALLTASGWKLGPDGVRRKNGKRLEIEMLYGLGSTVSSGIVTLIASYESAIGVSVSLKGLTSAAITDPSGPLYAGHFQVTLFAEESPGDPDARWILGCDQRAPDGFNFMRYCNPALDALFDKAAATGDMQERKRDYAVVQRILLRDLPIDFLSQIVEVDVVPDHLRGYASSMYTGPYTFVNRWRL